MAALWVILFIIGVPIVIVFWVVVALIIAAVHENKKSSKYTRINSASNPSKTSNSRRRRGKPTIIKLK